jgi:hypothetical protein
MRGRDAARPSLLGRIAVFFFVLAVLAATCATPSRAQVQAPVPAPPAASPSNEVLHGWRRGMTNVPLPKSGCFTSSYPNTGWQEGPA